MKWLLIVGLYIMVNLSSFGQSVPPDNKAQKTTLNNLPQSSLAYTQASLNFEDRTPIINYENNFENKSLDIKTNDFKISDHPQINGRFLQTPHPYPASECENSICNLTATLMQPILLQRDGILSFDEIVLVEPKNSTMKSKTTSQGDFVLVEASKDNGVTWQALTNEYNSGEDEIWENIFSSSVIDDQSLATGTQSIFLHRRIELIDGINFFENDTIFIRFRLSSDNSMNGWGWAIDNLAIEQSEIERENDFLENFNIYPNPCRDVLNVDCNNKYGPEMVNLVIVNQSGSIMYREDKVTTSSIRNKKINLSSYPKGIYSIIISDETYYKKAKKIIKY